MTPDALIAAVRAALPRIEIPDERIEIRDRDGRIMIHVVGDASWLDLLPASPAGQRKGPVMLAFYPLGFALLVVEIDTLARGEAWRKP